MKLATLIDKQIPESAFKLGAGVSGSDISPLAQWSGAAGMLCAPGCEAQTFMLLASFAAPLMSLFKTQEGGGVVSIHGGKKAGKSAALTAAATVWGPAAHVTIPAYRTDRLVRISRAGNYPVIIEGLLNRDPAHTREFLIDFLRLKPLPDHQWQTLLLSATGLPLFDTVLRPEDTRPGLDMHVKVPAMLIDAKAKGTLEYTLTACKGWAGMTYLRYLSAANVIQWCRMQLVSKLAGWRDDYGVGGDEHRFVLRTIAAVHVAGMIVSRLGIVDVEIDRITDFALRQALDVEKGAA
jgi:hypothetical protein